MVNYLLFENLLFFVGGFMLSPKRTKFRKYHRGTMRGKVFVRFLY